MWKFTKIGLIGKNWQKFGGFIVKAFNFWGNEEPIEIVLTPEGIAIFLATFNGVGDVTAKRIVQEFGLKTIDVVRGNFELLETVKGITPLKARSIHEQWKQKTKNKTLHQVKEMIRLYGVLRSPSLFSKAEKQFGKDLFWALSENPYRLTECPNVGFLVADKIALGMGIDATFPGRIQEAILYLLKKQAKDNGHCFLPYSQLKHGVKNLLKGSANSFNSFDSNLFQVNLNKLISSRRICEEKTAGNWETRYYLPQFFDAELTIAEQIQKLLELPLFVNKDRINNLLQEFLEYEREQGETMGELSDEQQEAVCVSQCSRISVLTGGPGSGKTRTSKAIVYLWRRQGKNVALAAPTGLAAQRLKDVTGEEARTIHKLLRWRGHNKFEFNAKNPLPYDALLIDESSMLDTELTKSLFDAINPRRTQIVFVGDADQLPPVNAGSFLFDLIASKKVPVVRLTKIFRQAEKSEILVHAKAINRGLFPIFRSTGKESLVNPDGSVFISTNDDEQGLEIIKELIAERIPELGYQRDQIQILCPQKKTDVGIRSLNRELQDIVNPPHKNKPEYSRAYLELNDDYDEDVDSDDVDLLCGTQNNKKEYIVKYRKGDRELRFRIPMPT